MSTTALKEETRAKLHLPHGNSYLRRYLAQAMNGHELTLRVSVEGGETIDIVLCRDRMHCGREAGDPDGEIVCTRIETPHGIITWQSDKAHDCSRADCSKLCSPHASSRRIICIHPPYSWL